MGGTNGRAGWRAGFLRALARSGSVKAAAQVARIDSTSAYAMRRRDPGFAAEWAEALARARATLGATGAAPALGPDEIVRASARGRPCVIRAGPGRWSAGKEAVFLEHLAASANVRAAAAAAGVSTVALYKRRAQWPGFAECWDSALAQGYARIEGLLIHAASETLEGPLITGERETPVMTIDQAMALFRLHRASVTGEGRRGRHDWRRAEPPIEEVRAEVLRRVKALGG